MKSKTLLTTTLAALLSTGVAQAQMKEIDRFKIKNVDCASVHTIVRGSPKWMTYADTDSNRKLSPIEAINVEEHLRDKNGNKIKDIALCAYTDTNVVVMRDINDTKKYEYRIDPRCIGNDKNFECKELNDQNCGPTKSIIREPTKSKPVLTDYKIDKSFGEPIDLTTKYLPQDLGGNISKVVISGKKALVSDSTAVLNDNLSFNKGNYRGTDSTLLDFIAVGAYRPFETQGELVVSYMHGIIDARKKGLGDANVGISSLDNEKLANLVGQKIFYKKESIVLTPEILANSLKHHAMAESVARYFVAKQNQENGYRVDVKDMVKRGGLQGLLRDAPILRIVLPINHITQGTLTGYDYTEHKLTERGEASVRDISNLSQNGKTLSGYESEVNAVTAKYLGGQL